MNFVVKFFNNDLGMQGQAFLAIPKFDFGIEFTDLVFLNNW
jgi:hypothetical protein